jgi:hypothetical protein
MLHIREFDVYLSRKTILGFSLCEFSPSAALYRHPCNRDLKATLKNAKDADGISIYRADPTKTIVGWKRSRGHFRGDVFQSPRVLAFYRHFAFLFIQNRSRLFSLAEDSCTSQTFAVGFSKEPRVSCTTFSHKLTTVTSLSKAFL